MLDFQKHLILFELMFSYLKNNGANRRVFHSTVGPSTASIRLNVLYSTNSGRPVDGAHVSHPSAAAR